MAMPCETLALRTQPSVLMVDDQVPNLLALEVILGELDVRLVRAQSGAEALRRLLAEDFALILLDVQMDDMDGFETAQLVRKRSRTRHTPIIFLTAHETFDASILKAYKLGAVDYIIKPFIPEILRAKVGVFVELHRKSGEVKRQAEQLRQHAAALEEVNRELESFSYSVSHDLRAPLRHMVGFLDLLERAAGTRLDADGQRYLTIVHNAARKAGRLVDDLLAFSRMSRVEMTYELVDMQALVQAVHHDLEPEIDGRILVWEVGPLPAVRGDPTMLRLVWENLLANAVKYTRTRAEARIQLGCKEAAGDYVFTISDNGVGFDMSYQDKLFGVFQRLHPAEEFEGTGIGLANVRRIVGRHGGQTWAEGAVDAGATFYFSLPKETR